MMDVCSATKDSNLTSKQNNVKFRKVCLYSSAWKLKAVLSHVPLLHVYATFFITYNEV